jgi:integrase
MRAQAGTPTTVAENTSALRGLLRWGAMHGYFSLEQSDLLPQRCLPVAPASPSPARPPRRRPDREVGEHEDYIRDEDAPSVAQVAAVGDSLQSRLANGRLSAEVAAEVGLRWGEQFQLTDRDITVVDGVVMVRVIAQVNWAARRSAGDPVRKLPKGEKTRSVPVPDVSQTGYPLRDELLSATERARQERLEGTNPEGLLFPTVTGKIFTHTGFMRDYFFPAAEQAGWPIDRWTETRTDGTTRQRRQLRHPWHSLRHRYARTCVDVYRYTEGELMAAGGWENKDVVSNRYYKHGSEHLKSAIAKLLASR